MKPKRVRNILFITWDGPENRYLERLFLPIFAGLRERGYCFHVLQFTWGEGAIGDPQATLCRNLGIPYRRVRIWRRFGAAGPFFSALCGAGTIRKAAAAWEIDTLMPRSLMPALAVLRLRRSEQQALNIVFDADGLAADERVDFRGLSPHGLTYRLLRDVEAELLRRSDIVLTRTEAARSILIARAGAALSPAACQVISNGVDPQPFLSALAGGRPGREQGFNLCYCGAIGAQYRLPDMLDIALRLKRKIQYLRFYILSPAVDHIGRTLAAKGLQAGWIYCQSVPAADVPKELARCNLGIALREPTFSTQAVLPVKLGEYLLAGLPIIGTPGVGNTSQLEAEGVFRSAEADDLDGTIRWIVDEVRPRQAQMRRRSHEAGMRYFSLEQTVEHYARALEACSALYRR